MSIAQYERIDFQYIAAGAAILGSGGGGSYCDVVNVLEELIHRGWNGVVPVRDYDSATHCCVLALMGSPDTADNLTLADIEQSITNTVNLYQAATGTKLGCAIAVEIGPINSIAPLIAATLSGNTIQSVVNGDGAGRVVPQLPQTTYDSCATLAASHCVLAMYSSLSSLPEVVAPDSICYYSESTGRGFSNATNDLAQYFNASTGKSTGKTISILKVAAARKYYKSAGVIVSFAGLLRDMGYAGALPYS